MIKNINSNTDNIELHKEYAYGKVKVELFDAHTKEKVFEEEGSNFLTNFGKDYIKSMAKMALGQNMAGFVKTDTYSFGSSLNVVHNSDGYFAWLYLTDEDSAESPSTQNRVEGDIIGFAGLTPVVSTNVKQGSINLAECEPSLNSIKMVYDFPTDRANGTFQSIYYSHLNNITTANVDTATGFSSPRTILTVITDSDIFPNGGVADSGTHFYFANSNTNNIYRIDKSTYAATLIHTGDMVLGSSITYHNNFLYYRNGATLYRYNLSTDVEDSLIVNSTAGGITNDGTSIYIATNTVIRRVDIATFTNVDSKTFDIGTGNHRMAYANGQLYVSVTGLMYKIDYANNTTEITQIEASPSGSGSNNIYSSPFGVSYNGSTSLTRVLFATVNMIPGPTAVTRKRLSSPVTKNDTQTMKVTYTFNFV